MNRDTMTRRTLLGLAPLCLGVALWWSTSTPDASPDLPEMLVGCVEVVCLDSRDLRLAAVDVVGLLSVLYQVQRPHGTAGVLSLEPGRHELGVDRSESTHASHPKY